MRDLDPDLALDLPVVETDLVEASLFGQRIAAQLVGTFGVVGLLLAAMGIYGVLSFQVVRRTRELGVRRALGARSGHVVAGVVRHGGLVALVGCVLGMGAGALLAQTIRSFLIGIRPLDLVTFAGVPAVLLVVALLASWVPAVRATSVEASEALRSE